MRGIKEAPLVKSFAAAPEPDEEEERPAREPLALYKGWLPVDDEVNDSDSPSLRVTLEAFIREVINAE